MNDNILIGVQRAVIIDKDSKVLVVRNLGKQFWHYPGGKWEPSHESITEGVAREIAEEVGLTELKFSFLAMQELRRESKTYIETYWSVYIDESASNIDLKIQTEEIEEVRWVNINELESYGVLPAELVPLLQSSSRDNRFLGTF